MFFLIFFLKQFKGLTVKKNWFKNSFHYFFLRLYVTFFQMNFHLLLYDMSPFPYVELIIHIYFCVSFSEPLMDLLVTLCAKYRLNPSSHTLELITSNKNNIKLKPSALIGTLDAEKIILKPKGEDKNKKTGPQMPEVHEYIERYSLTHSKHHNRLSTCLLLCSPGNCSDGDKLQKDPENYIASKSSSPPCWTITSNLWEMWIWRRDNNPVERCPIKDPFKLVQFS